MLWRLKSLPTKIGFVFDGFNLGSIPKIFAWVCHPRYGYTITILVDTVDCNQYIHRFIWKYVTKKTSPSFSQVLFHCHLGVQEKTPDHISHFTNISDTSVANNDQKPTFKTPRPSSQAEKRAAKPTASRSSQAPLSSRESFHFKVLEKVLRRLLTIIPFNPWNPKSNEHGENLLKIGLKHWNMYNSYIQLPHLATPTLNHTVILRHTHPYAGVDHDAAEDSSRPSYKSNLAMSTEAIGHGLIPILPNYHLYYSVYIYYNI